MPPVEEAAPAVESSAPAAEVSTGAETTPSTDNTTPSAPAIQDNPDWSDEQFIGEALKKIGGPEDTTTEPAAEPAAPEVPAEEAPAEETPEGEEPPAEEKPAEPADEEPQLDLEGPMAPSALEQKINANPELKALLDKDPALRGEMFKSARLAQEAYKYREIFPDHKAAQLAAGDASMWRKADAAFYSSPKEFVDTLVEMATLVGQDGQPLRDANGHIQVDQSLTNILDFIGNNEWNHRFENWLKQERASAEKDGDERALAALDILAERKQQSGRRADEEVPEHIKQREAALKAKEDASARQDAERLQVAKSQAFDSVITKVDAGVAKLIDPIINRSALTDKMKEKAKDDINDRLEQALKADSDYQSRKLRYDNSKTPLTEAQQGEYVALVTSAAQSKLSRIVKEVLDEYSKPVVDAKAAKDAKVAAQQKRSQQELRGAAAPATQKPLEGQALLDKITADFEKANPGQSIDTYTLLLKANEYKQNLRKAVANR